MTRSTLNWMDWVSQAMGRRPLRRRVQPQPAVLAPETLEDRALLSASSSMSAGRWTINADVDPGNPSEIIVVQQSPTDSNKLQVVINGTTFSEKSAKRVRAITINSGAGDDTVTVQLPESLNRISVTVNGGSGNDNLTANSHATLRGGDGDDVLTGSEANDSLFGGKGDDILVGNGGDDLLQGDDGGDTLRGGEGRNRLNGGKGRDWIYSGDDADSVATDDTDVRGIEKQGGLQQFQSETDFQEWLIHSAAVNLQLGRGNIFYATMGAPWMDSVRGTSTPGSESTAGAGGDFSGTNTQVNGVDEQDIVETDGNYIYTVNGEELVIVDVRDPAAASVVSRTELAGWGSEMYLDGDRLTVISSVSWWHAWDVYPVGMMADARFAMPIWNWRPQTEVTTYDISNPAEPKLLEDTTFDGSVSTSRSVDGRIYLVANNNLWLWQPDVYYITLEGDTDASGSIVPEDPADLSKLDWSTVLPQYTTKSYDAEGNETITTGSLLETPNIWAPNDPLQNTSLTSILMIDIHQGEAGIDSTTTVFGVTGDVYASANSLYLASQDWSNVSWDGSDTSGPMTALYKFDLTTDGSTLAASGSVDGTILNQFAMDESDDGSFRIATTSNTWQANESSNVFVLQQQGDKLVTVSSLTGLSPGERIYSARFLGDQLYLSTFHQVDPLLSIDLSDPLNPTVDGQLEVPGFSSYLQQWGDHFLVSIGQDADPETGRVTGLQLSLFDIGDTQNPQLVSTYKLSITAWDTYSQAQWDHHAFSLFDEEGILAIPVSRWDVETGYSAQLDVFQLDEMTGFKLLGAVSHDSEVLRSLRIGDDLFSLSYSTLKINDLTNPATEIAEVVLQIPDPVIDPTDPPVVILPFDPDEE